MDEGPPSPWTTDWQGWWRGRLQGFESEAASGMERFVAGDGFAEMLVNLTENASAMSRLSADFWDLVLRNLRVVGRADIDRLARQLAGTEDKLERLLQAVEPIRQDVLGR